MDLIDELRDTPPLSDRVNSGLSEPACCGLSLSLRQGCMYHHTHSRSPLPTYALIASHSGELSP